MITYFSGGFSVVVFPPGTLTGTISTNEFCIDGSIKPKQIQSGDHVKIQHGCQIRTMRHLIYTENEDEFSLQPLVFKWNWDAEKLFPKHGSQAVHELIAAMDPKDGRSYDATNLLQHLDVLKTQADSILICSSQLQF